MMQERYYDDVLSSLVKRVNYLERRIGIQEAIDNASAVGITHGGLAGLDNDDHAQYHNDARGDVRYYTKTQLTDGQLDTRYYTKYELENAVLSQVHWGNLSNKPDLVTPVGGPEAGRVAIWVDSTQLTLADFGAGEIVRTSTDQTVAGVKTWSGNAVFSSRVGIGAAPDVLLSAYGNSGEVAGVIGRRTDLTRLYSAYAGQSKSAFEVAGGDSTFGALVISKEQSSTTGLIGALYYANTAAGTEGTNELRLVQLTGQCDNALDSGALSVSLSNGGTLTERVRFLSNGNVGIGTTSPQGRLHVHDGTGGSLFWTATGIAGSAVTIIPDGTGDVVRRIAVYGVIRGSNGVTRMLAQNQGTFNTSGEPGTEMDLFDSATNVVKLRVNANGSVDVRRTAGTLTYDVALHLVWL